MFQVRLYHIKIIVEIFYMNVFVKIIINIRHLL